jgi:hypothetical protein
MTVILSQPTGAITLWPAKWFYHGSSVDVREETADEEKSVGLTLVQKSPLLSFCWTSALNKVINLEAIQWYYYRPDSNVTFGPQNKLRKRKLSKEKRRRMQRATAALGRYSGYDPRAVA